MSIRYFIILLAICVIWTFQPIIMKGLSDETPPLFFVAMRMTLVALALSPFLRWRPHNTLRLLAVGVCLGGPHFVLFLLGLTLAPASAAVIVGELYTPFVTILAVIFLGEQVRWRRGVGVALAFLGVVVIAWPNEAVSGGRLAAVGLACVALSALVESFGTIALKQIQDMRAIEISAVTSLIGAIVLWGATATFESGQWAVLQSESRTLIIGGLLYSAFATSMVAHTAYYWLLQRLPIAVLAPSALIGTVMSVIAAVVIFNEPVTVQLVVGGVVTLIGIGVILIRVSQRPAGVGPAPFLFVRRGFRALMRSPRQFPFVKGAPFFRQREQKNTEREKQSVEND
ncbi:MAG: DMT family transporter [Pseudomonadota bacterium]